MHPRISANDWIWQFFQWHNQNSRTYQLRQHSFLMNKIRPKCFLFAIIFFDMDGYVREDWNNAVVCLLGNFIVPSKNLHSEVSCLQFLFGHFRIHSLCSLDGNWWDKAMNPEKCSQWSFMYFRVLILIGKEKISKSANGNNVSTFSPTKKSHRRKSFWADII